MASASFLLILSDFGIDLLAIRYLSQGKFTAKQLYSNLTFTKVVWTLACIAFVGFSFPLFAHQPAQATGWILILSSGVSSLGKYFRSPFYAVERMEVEARITFIDRTTQAILACLLIALGFNALGYAISLLIGSCVGLILSLSALKSLNLSISFTPSPQFTWPFLKSAFPIGLNAIFVLVYYRIDTIMLSYFRSEQEVGLYGTAYLIILGMMTFSSAVTQSLFPTIARLTSSENELHLLTQLLVKHIFLAVAPMVIVLSLASDTLFKVIFGLKYLEAAPVFSILVFQIIFVMITPVFGNILRSTDKQHLMAWITGTGALINVGLNFLFIPNWGMIGAAYTTLICEMFVFLASGVTALLRTSFSLGSLSKPSLILLATVALSFSLLKDMPWPYVVSLFLVVYVGACIMLNCINKRELQELRTLLR